MSALNPKMINKKCIVVLFAVSCVLIATGLSGCGQAQSSETGFSGMPPMPVVVYTVASQTLNETLALVGTIDANERVHLASEVDGIIQSIYFEEGEHVAAGQVLIQLDQAQLQAEFAQATASWMLAASNLERFKALRDSGAVSKQEVDQTIAAHETAKAHVDLYNERLKDATLRAPFDGVIGARLVSPGQYISRGTAIAQLIDQQAMKVTFQVPERYIAQVKQGQSVQFKVAAYVGALFKGTIYFIDPQVDERTRSVMIKARVANADSRLRQGMVANIDVTFHVDQAALVIPEAALMWNSDQASVYVVGQDSKVEMRVVKPGVRLAGKVAIEQGLKPGDVVITEGLQKVFPGAQVMARQEQHS